MRNRGKQLCGVFLYGFRRLYLSKADSITDTCMDFDIKSRQFCFLLKIQKNYDCFFILYSLLNRFQRRGPLEDIAQRNFTCFTWTDKFKLITWNFLISYFMRQDDLINVHLENFEYFESLQKWLSMSEFMFIENSFIEDNVLFSVT